MYALLGILKAESIAIVIAIALAILWLPFYKFFTDVGTRRGFGKNCDEWTWDLNEYILVWCKILAIFIIIVPLSFIAAFSLFTGEFLTAITCGLIAFGTYKLKKYWW